MQSFHPLKSACLVAMVLLGSSAHASIIGVGLDWRSGIFVQEMWHQGRPAYLIANLSKADIELTVHEFDSRWRLGQPLPKEQAGPWKIAAGKHLLVSAKEVQGDALRRFVINGKDPIGVLPGVKDPHYEGKGYATGQGLNGSGGSTPGVYIVQPERKLVGGATVELELHLPSQAGVVKFNLMPEPSDDPLRPKTLIVESAKCETLPVTRDEKQIAIDTMAPLQAAASHKVVLTISLPAVQTDELHMLDGWRAQGAGGSGITRGLWVTPKEK